MSDARAMTLVCYDGSIEGSKSLSSDAALIVVHHLHRKDAYNLPKGFPQDTKSGIYVLVGQDEENGDLAYIGESHDVLSRIKNKDHKNDKEWWTSIYIFQRDGKELNQSLRLYIENQMINDKKIQRFTLANKKISNSDKINLGDQINGNMLYKAMTDACKSIGFHLFDKISKPNKRSTSHNLFTLKGKKHEAYLEVRGGSFFLLPGTVLSKISPGLQYPSVKSMRASYKEGDILTNELEFKSPSAAAAFAAGVNLSGRGEWVNSNNKTLGQWQDGE